MRAISEQEEKTCADCGGSKPVMRFHRKRVGADGRQQYQSWCKECQKERARKQRERNIDHYRYRDREKYNAQKRAAQRLRKYGVPQEQFDAMLLAQGGRCAICMEVFERPQSACVDHCHQSGRVRGVLCDLCNRALGYLRDDSGRAQRLVEYLNEGEI